MTEREKKDGRPERALRVSGLAKSYDGVPVFCNVNLELAKGGVYCLNAPSGAGKTTLLRILMGLETADRGEVELGGNGRIAAVFQEDRLCPWLDAAGNIRLVNPRYEAVALKRELTRLLPEDSLKKPASEFSGGMRRRLSLLRALLSEGELLLFDEPFNGLDKEARQAAIEYVKSRRNGRTLLFTTHHMEEAQALKARRLEWRAQELTWRPVDSADRPDA